MASSKARIAPTESPFLCKVKPRSNTGRTDAGTVGSGVCPRASITDNTAAARISPNDLPIRTRVIVARLFLDAVGGPALPLDVVVHRELVRVGAETQCVVFLLFHVDPVGDEVFV